VDGSGDTAAYKARSADEMNKITALVKSAMGFDPARGDQVQVTNMQFARMDQTVGTEAPKPLLGLDPGYWFKIIEAAILCLTALLIGLFVAKPLINRMFAAQAVAAGGTTRLANASPVAGALPAPAGTDTAVAHTQDGTPVALPAPKSSIDVSRIDGQVRESSIKKVGEVVSAHPEEALAIIRTWLHQPV
jgi:flagellar M-ring protein FliF